VTVSSQQVIARFPGEAFELSAEALARAAAASSDLRARLVDVLQTANTLTAAASACGLLHGTMQRLCRGLLEAQDRLGETWLPLTQEDLSTMLGVQRTTVTVLAGDLKQRGLIDYRRGKIRLLDRPALRLAACECYPHDAAHDGGPPSA
jgi:CRP-like cAMP-binding protein